MPKTKTEQLYDALEDLADEVESFLDRLREYEDADDEHQNWTMQFPLLEGVSSEQLLREILNHSQALHKAHLEAFEVLSQVDESEPEPKRLPPGKREPKRLPQGKRRALLLTSG